MFKMGSQSSWSFIQMQVLSLRIAIVNYVRSSPLTRPRTVSEINESSSINLLGVCACVWGGRTLGRAEAAT